jgi:putative ABC transport system permease protein
MLRDLIQDLRHGARLLLRSPGFTLLTVLTLALGIGATTALFSVTNSVLLRPLAFPDAERLVMVYETNLGKGWNRFTASPANYLDWRDRTRSLDALAAFSAGNYVLTGGEAPERIRGSRVTPQLFTILGIPPETGRALRADDDRPGAPAVAVIGHALWADRFGSDPHVLGRTLTLDGVPYTIVGVMPARFKFMDARFWIPMAWDAAQRTARGDHDILVMGRLAPGATLRSARAELEPLAARLAKDHPDTNAGWGIFVSPLFEEVVGGSRRTLLILLGATGFVLLTAGANVANLLLARASARSKEMAIRAALGAGRGRVVRQLLAETVMLTGLGGAAGVLVALWGLDLLRLLPGMHLPRASEIGIDARVLLFAAGTSIATGLLFGLAPALRASRPNLQTTLKEGSGTAAFLGRDRLRSLLVVLETSLAAVLLIGASLLLHSLWRLQSVDMGFRTDHLLTFTISLPRASYADEERRALFYGRLLEQVRALPGVRAASAVSSMPIADNDTVFAFIVDGSRADSAEAVPSATFYAISPDYFTTMGIPLRAGRAFTDADGAGSPGVMLVNETMARQHFGGSPIGKIVHVGNRDATPVTIVGIVGDVKHDGLSSLAKAQMYQPISQQPVSAMSFAVRSTVDPGAIAASVRHEVATLDRDLPIFDVNTMTSIVASALAPQRSSAILLLVFAALAMALASIGIYGVISYSVTQRTREIGVRMALGAARGDVLRLVVGQGLRLTLAGLAVGVAAAFALTRLLTRMLFGVGPLDPLTFTAIPVLLALVALAACYLPARRAARVDPMDALRCE